MKILITGMGGFVGAAITKRLFHTDHELIGIVRDKSDLPEQILDKYRIIKADISKPLPKIDCDVVIHTAATVNERVLAVLMNKTNVDGTRHILQATPESSKFIYVSSASVYNLAETNHKEDELINPKLLNSYGRSKYFSEQLIQNEFPSRSSIIVRPRAVYGPGDKVILPRLLSVYKDGKIRVPGDLNQKASMTHIDFLTDALMEFIFLDKPGQHIYNVADYYDYNLGENILSLFSKVFNRDIQLNSLNEPLVRIFSGMRSILVPGNQFTQTSIDYLTKDHVISTEKLQSDFPHLQSVPFHQNLDDYVQWINTVGISKIKQVDKRIVWM